MICLNPDILTKLSSKGILAYVAVSMAGDVVASTATLSGLVRGQTAAMLEGLKELAAVAPELVTWNGKPKTWTCGKGGPLQELDSSLRFRDLVEDLKKYWDFLNPEVPFSFSGSDGVAVRGFLSDHPKWTREMWQEALQNRGRSVRMHGNGSRTEDIARWVRRLGGYAVGALNEFNKPVEGGGKHGQAITVRQFNREAVQRAIASA
jgi:hypothetical protein